MIIGLIVFAIYLYFSVGFDQILLVVRSFNLQSYLIFYLLSIGTMILVILCWVSSWRTLLRALGVEISLKNGFFYYWTGYFVDLIVPCQSVCGEITRLYLVQKETQKNYGAPAAAGITNRIVAYSIVTIGLTTGLIYLLLRNNIPAFARILLTLSCFGALTFVSVLYFLAFSDKGADRLASFILKILKALKIKRFGDGALSPGIMETLRGYHEGFKFFRANPRYLIKPILFQACSYTLNLTVYVLVFYALGFNNLIIDFFLLVYFLAGAIQDATAAFSVGGLEILLTNLFIFFGIGSAKSGVAAVVLRSVTFWFPLIVGYAIVQVVGARSLLSPKLREKIDEEQKKEIQKESSGAAPTDSSP